MALQHVLPDKAVPQTYKTGIPTIIVGIDPHTGQSFTDHSAEVYAGWCNAAKGLDAWGAQNASFGNLWKATAEINESLYPHVQWGRDYRTDSGGPGQWRGLCGSHYEKEVCVDAKVYTYVVGMKYPMPGICGGEPGEPNRMVIRYGSDDEFVVKHTADWVPIAAGERIMYDYGGGGGWGNPLDRDPQAVLDDVLDEYVSIEGASRAYFFRRVTLPLLMPTTLFVLVNAVINAFRLVDHVVVMTRGGPDNATELLLFYIYEIGFRFWDSAYAAALTMVLLLLLGTVALLQFWFLERKVHYQ